MKRKIRRQSPETRPLFEAVSPHEAAVALDKDDLTRSLHAIEAEKDLAAIKNGIARIRQTINSSNGDQCDPPNASGETVSLRRDVLISDLDQILDAQTVERARYYVKRLTRAIGEAKTSKINDINLRRWKEYTEVITDSLWVLPRRDTSGAHLGWYWGNFIPQIPHQLMLRYTKRGDWVLDPFLGSGTTLIECRRLGRNGIGIELNPEIAERSRQLVGQQPARHGSITDVLSGDARSFDVGQALDARGVETVQLLVLHPPYHDIIEFSEDERDLSRAATPEVYLKMFAEVLDNLAPVLEKGRYLALVIGDKYAKGEWIPLGFQCMNEVLNRGFSLKSIVVKNFDETRAKRDQKQLWRYRALVGGFYIFKHEYVFIFKKN
ncbi:MAG TPA: DNA methyltransferase [Blastocatellia bacterium]|nr:DNA methyltransferase [Blastocatellia bacterium]